MNLISTLCRYYRTCKLHAASGLICAYLLHLPMASANTPISTESQEKGVSIKGFSLNWATQTTDLQHFDHSALLDLWLNELGPRLTVADMHVIAQRLTRELRKRGYQFHQVVIPNQELTDGILRLRILEGKIGTIDVRGNKKYNANTLRKPVAELKSQTIYQPQIEEAVELINAYPGLKVFSYYSRGTETGTANINLSVIEEDGFEGQLEIDNFGHDKTGRNRGKLNLTWHNPSGKADQLNLTFLSAHTSESNSSENNNFGAINYRLPLSSSRHSVEISYAKNNFELGGDFRDLDLSGVSDTVSASYSYKSKFQKRSRRQFFLSMALSNSDIESGIFELQSLLNQSEETRSLTFGWNGFSINKKQNASSSYNIGLKYGQWEFVEPIPEQRPNYQKFNISLSQQFRFALPGTWYNTLLSLNLNSQYADDALPAVEKMGLTGYQKLSALRPGYFSADRGATFKMHLQSLYFPHIKPSIFYETSYGEQYGNDELLSRALLSASGVAITAQYKQWEIYVSYATVSSARYIDISTAENDSLFLSKVVYKW